MATRETARALAKQQKKLQKTMQQLDKLQQKSIRIMEQQTKRMK